MCSWDTGWPKREVQRWFAFQLRNFIGDPEDARRMHGGLVTDLGPCVGRKAGDLRFAKYHEMGQ